MHEETEGGKITASPSSYALEVEYVEYREASTSWANVGPDIAHVYLFYFPSLSIQTHTHNAHNAHTHTPEYTCTAREVHSADKWI